MSITINNMTLGEVYKATKMESMWLKLGKLISAVAMGLVALFMTTYYLKNKSNVLDLQSQCEYFKERDAPDGTLFKPAGPYHDSYI